MPEYMTKSEPVDKKPYIVYTDEKGILYSGDPDSDIPGGGGDGGTVKCYIINFDDWDTPLSTEDVSVEDGNGASVSVSTDELTVKSPMGTDETLACLSFAANVGGVYKIGRGTSAHYLTAGTLNLTTLGPGTNLPCAFEDGTLSFITPNVNTVASLTLG